MRLPGFVLTQLAWWACDTVMAREPDFVIGRQDDPYLKRWFVIPRNRWFNIYLHLFLRDDDDRALHDHPWVNCSILLAGKYLEHTIAAGGIGSVTERVAGDIKLRLPSSAHRLALPKLGDYARPAISLFITGPRVREWGFHCPDKGWVHWREFTEGPSGELVGKGCD